MLNHSENYTHVSLVENDVLLADNWFADLVALFDGDRSDDLVVGAGSARCYEDRILIQRDGYAICHNLGAGHVIFTREAARLILDHFRTGYTTENRAVFSQLSGIDVGKYWAFRGGEHALCADWGFDRVLASHGLASLALTPSKATMIGQVPPLEEQGLILVTQPLEALRNEEAFARYKTVLNKIRSGQLTFPDSRLQRDPSGTVTVFPHQVAIVGGVYAGDWELKWTQGLGPFSWRSAAENATLDIPIFGACDVIVGGVGKFELSDEHSGFRVTPDLSPLGPDQMLSLNVPSILTYRTLRLTALNPGVLFYGIRCAQPQPLMSNYSFDHLVLPAAGATK